MVIYAEVYEIRIVIKSPAEKLAVGNIDRTDRFGHELHRLISLVHNIISVRKFIAAQNISLLSQLSQHGAQRKCRSQRISVGTLMGKNMKIVMGIQVFYRFIIINIFQGIPPLQPQRSSSVRCGNFR